MLTKNNTGWAILLAVLLSATSMVASAQKPFEGEKLIATAYAGPYWEAIKAIIVAKFEEDTGATVELVPSAGDELALIGAAPEDAPPFDVIAAWSPDWTGGS